MGGAPNQKVVVEKIHKFRSNSSDMDEVPRFVIKHNEKEKLNMTVHHQMHRK